MVQDFVHPQYVLCLFFEDSTVGAVLKGNQKEHHQFWGSNPKTDTPTHKSKQLGVGVLESEMGPS